MEVLLVVIVLSTASGLVGRSAGSATRVVIAFIAIAATLTYTLFPRFM
jgi:hypothetical protein